MKIKDRYGVVYALYYGYVGDGKEFEIECFKNRELAVERRNSLIREHSRNVPSSATDFSRIEVISNDGTTDFRIKINRESVISDENLSNYVWVVRSVYKHVSDQPIYDETVYDVFGTLEAAKNAINERSRVLLRNHTTFNCINYDDSYYTVVNHNNEVVSEFKIKEVRLL